MTGIPTFDEFARALRRAEAAPTTNFVIQAQAPPVRVFDMGAIYERAQARKKKAVAGPVIRETCPPRHKFRVGDRVMGVGGIDLNIVGRGIGKIGTVLSISRGGGATGVRFDEDVNGHDGIDAGMTCENGHGWYVNTRYLKYLGMRVNPATVVPPRRRR